MNATTSRRLAAVAALLALPALSSCGGNFKAQTDQVYTPAEGVNNRDGQVDVLNALIVSDSEGTGRLIAGFSNNTDKDETVTSVTGVGVDQQISFEMQGGEFTVPGNGFLQLADTDGGVISASGDPVKAGYFVSIRLQFSDAEPVDLSVPVVAPGEDFTDVAIPTPTPTSDSSGG